MQEEVFQYVLFLYPDELLPGRGFQPVSREYVLPSGGKPDLSLRDADGCLWILEVKPHLADGAAVEQLNRYVMEIRQLRAAPCKAALVTPAISTAAQERLREYRMELFIVTPDLIQSTAERHALTLGEATWEDRRLDFWWQWRDIMSSGSTIPLARIARPSPKLPNYLDIRTGVSGVWVTVRCNLKKRWLDVDLTFSATKRDTYRSFKARVQDSLRADFDSDIQWNEERRESHVKLQRHTDTRDIGRWPEYHAWLKVSAEKMYAWALRVES